MYIVSSVFLINSYGGPNSFIFGTAQFSPDGAVNYDYIVTNSINSVN